MATTYILFFTEKSNLEFLQTQELLSRFVYDPRSETGNPAGPSFGIRDYFKWYGEHYVIQKRDIDPLEFRKHLCQGYITLDFEWVDDDDFKDNFEKYNESILEYFNSVPDDTWIYGIVSKE